MLDHGIAGQILAIEIGPHTTVREYLADLLCSLWRDGDDFEPADPTGRTHWQIPVYRALVRHGFVTGRLDDEYLREIDDKQADQLIDDVIRVMTGT